jgi:ribosomal protein S6-L-glutamate ligase RimK-like protein
MLGVVYEHPEWFVPLFAELDRRGVAYRRVLADQLEFGPAEREVEFALVFNRMSPSAYLRGHQRAIFAAQQYLAYLEQLKVPTINGLAAYTLELSKARQLQLLAQLQLPAPKTRVLNATEKLTTAAHQLEFPVIVKPNVGGSGARMRRFESAAELQQACNDKELEDLFEIDGTALVQEYHPPIGGSIVRVEVLDGEFLYAIRIYNDPNDGFNLCPADICQVADDTLLSQDRLAGVDALDLCPVEVTAKPGRKIDAVRPPDWVIDAVLKIAEAGKLDLGGVEYLESDRDGELYFYDINALSNFVTDAPNLVGFDPFERLGALVEQRLQQAYARVPGHGAKALSGLATPRSVG